jgi:hypothetical protein
VACDLALTTADHVSRKDLQSDATERVDRAWGLMSEYLANEPDSLDSRDGGSAE